MGDRRGIHGERVEKRGLTTVVLADNQVKAGFEDQFGGRIEALVVGDLEAA